MNLPNRLTILRIILIPVMIVFCYIDWFRNNNAFLSVSWLYLVLVIIFILASLTDFLDGYLARKNNSVTTFGQFADPLADKMLTFSAMTILMLDGLIPMWVFIIILIREFMVSGIRMVVASEGIKIPAAKLGKWKTFITMIAIIILFFSGLAEWVKITGIVFIYIACILTVLSGIEYFWKNRKNILKSI